MQHDLVVTSRHLHLAHTRINSTGETCGSRDGLVLTVEVPSARQRLQLAGKYVVGVCPKCDGPEIVKHLEEL